jgi:hypothetical protein
MPKIASQRIVRVSTNGGRSCSLCNGQFQIDGIENFDASCNHLMQAHNLKCLHVGQETVDGHDGKPWQTTVAVFGV